MKIDFFRTVSFDKFLEVILDYLGDIVGVDGGDNIRILRREGKNPFIVTFRPFGYDVLNDLGQVVLNGRFIGKPKTLIK